jgi:hypothetical protein
MRATATIRLLIALSSIAATPAIASADEDVSIVINGRTGEAFLRNDSSATLELDGYLLRSPVVDNVFDAGSWDSLQDNVATPGWSESLATGNRLGEVNLFASTSIGPGETIGIGSPYLPLVPGAIGEQEPGLSSINFSYSVDGDEAFPGDVEFIARNTVVLEVDPTTGEAALVNQSQFGVSIDGYLIQSVPAVLDVGGWTPLQQSLGGPGGWTASAGADNRIAEGNLFGSSFLAPNGGFLSIGAPVDPALLDDETDLTLEFSVAGVGAVLGGVLFNAAAVPVLPGDYNGNGIVDAADYTVWRDQLGQNFTLTNEVDGVTPGMVTPEDYDEWVVRFGNTVGMGSASGSGTLQSTAVPEPAAAWLLVCCSGWYVVGRILPRRDHR